MDELLDIEIMVVIASIQPFLVLWVAAITFFLAMAATAMLSVDRPWHELVVIFQLSYIIFFFIAFFSAQWLADVEIIQIETIERMYVNR